MALVYQDRDDLILTSRVSSTLLNKIFDKLLKNDENILPTTYNVPYIWEAYWFNDNQIQGYNEGDAVWINTENEDDFIRNNSKNLYNYLSKNYKYQEEILRNSDNQTKLNQLYKKVIQSGELYYIGDILKPAQIRVCKNNNVKSLPTDDNDWEDFFELRDDEKLKRRILSQVQEITNTQFKEHLNMYHPEYSLDFNLDDYLMKDFSNITNQQRYNKLSINKMSGFDKVKLFVSKDYGEKSKKWFRIWQSGQLEQGGIIDIENLTEYDSLNYSGTKGKICTIGLNWKYNGTSIAPVYDYTRIDMTPFYFLDTQIKIEESDSFKLNETDQMGSSRRYFISLTPCNDTQNIYKEQNEKYMYYNTREVTSLTNKSFSFIINQDCRYYSYYISGFTVSTVSKVNS